MMTDKKLTALALTAFTAIALSHASFGEFSVEETTSHTANWKADVHQKLENKHYEDAFKHLLQLETDHADTSADWHNLMGYTMRMLDLPDLEASEHHYIKAVELQADHKGALEYYGELKLQQNDLEGARKFVARLTEVCPEGCDELETLKKSISEFEAKQK